MMNKNINLITIAMIFIFIAGMSLMSYGLLKRQIEKQAEGQSDFTAPPRPWDVHPNGPPKYKFGDRVLCKGYWELIIVSDAFFEYNNDQWLYIAISSYSGNKILENSIDDPNYSRGFLPISENELQYKDQIPTRHSVDTIALPEGLLKGNKNEF